MSTTAKILVFGVLPITLIGVGYYVYANKQPYVSILGFLPERQAVRIQIDKNATQDIESGECQKYGKWSICFKWSDTQENKVTIEKYGAIYNQVYFI